MTENNLSNWEDWGHTIRKEFYNDYDHWEMHVSDGRTRREFAADWWTGKISSLLLNQRKEIVDKIRHRTATQCEENVSRETVIDYFAEIRGWNACADEIISSLEKENK